MVTKSLSIFKNLCIVQNVIYVSFNPFSNSFFGSLKHILSLKEIFKKMILRFSRGSEPNNNSSN